MTNTSHDETCCGIRSPIPEQEITLMASERISDRAFLGTSALLFAVCSALTAVWSKSMAAMGAMPMEGGWVMSMTWMRTPGQGWAGQAASFVGMWVVMMAAMMLPSLVPMLNRYRAAVSLSETAALNGLTAVAGLGYLSLWAALGMAVFPFGLWLTQLEMSLPAVARAVPAATSAVVLLAGAVQFSGWKLRYLACCREGLANDCALRTGAGSSLRHGIRLGVRCSVSCANLTAILLAIGVMDLSTMALVTAAITAERLAPDGARVAKVTGTAIIGLGVFLMARAIAHA
jgi:predicted metal-binding membrane protein